MKKLLYTLCFALISTSMTHAQEPSKSNDNEIELAAQLAELPEVLKLMLADLQTYDAQNNQEEVMEQLTSDHIQQAAEAFYKTKQLRDAMLQKLAEFSVAMKMAAPEQKEKLQENLNIYIAAFNQLQKEMLVALQLIEIELVQ